MSEEATKVELSEEMGNFVSYIENLTVLELSNLVSVLEDRLGVTAAAPVAVAVAGGGAAEGVAEEVEEKTEFDVVLTSFGEKKIAVIKEVRAMTGLGLKEAKDLVESVPKAVKEGAGKDEAEEMKTKLEAAGATVELK